MPADLRSCRPILSLAVCLLVVLSVSARADIHFVTKWGSYGTGNSQFDFPTDVALDLSGNVYVADNLNHRIQKFSSAGGFLTKWGSNGTGDSQFDGPGGIAVSPSDNVYVADTSNHRIQQFDSDGGFVRKWGSEGTGDSQFNSPCGLTVDASGTVYVADTWNYRLQTFDSEGTLLQNWGYLGPFVPVDVAVDASGNVYVFQSWVWKFDSGGTLLTQWGSAGTGDGQFDRAAGIAVSPSGSVYVADTYNSRIQKFDSDGTFLTKWGSQGTGAGEFIGPGDVDVDGSGNVYVADTYNHRIQVFKDDAPPPAPTVDVTPDWPEATDDLTVSALSVDPDGDTVSYSYRWYVNGIHADDLDDQTTVPAAHTADGETWRCVVTPSDGFEQGATGEDSVVIGGSRPQPDMRARFAGQTTWTGNNVYGRAGLQTVAKSVNEGGTQVYQLSLQNDGSDADIYRVYGKGFSGRWQIRYYSKLSDGTDITDKITGESGWQVNVRAGKARAFRAEITAADPAPGGSRRTAAVRAVSQSDGVTTDAVRLVLRVRSRWQPDARIKLPSGSAWTGNNVYNTNASGQVRKRTVATGKRAIYRLSMQNDGNVQEALKIIGPGGNAKWKVRYFDAFTGGTDVTAQVTGTGWTTLVLNPAKAQEMRLEITPKAAASGGDKLAAKIIATSTGKPTQTDAVKAVTTVKSTSATSVCQVTSLAAIPTHAGAEITLTLSSDAKVTATILNLAGRPIKTIAADRPLVAGTQILLWNRTNETGLAVPHGIYLVRVRARNQAGGESSGLASLALR